LFYSHSPATIYQRYFAHLKSLPRETVQQMVTMDYCGTMAIVGEIPCKGGTRLIAVARYYRDPSCNWAEVAVTVHEDFQRRGIATFLLQQLAKVAAQHSIVGFKADVLSQNTGMLKTFFKVASHVQTDIEGGVVAVRFELKNVAKAGEE